MKKIPETFELDDDDIRKAITYLVDNEYHNHDEKRGNYDITIRVDQLTIDGLGRFSATVVKK